MLRNETFRRAGRTLLGLLALACASPATAAELGKRVDNVASISWRIGSAPPSSLSTPAASFVIEAARTPSSIDFFRYAPGAPGAAPILLNGSDYLPSGAGAFAPVGPLVTLQGASIDTSAPAPLLSAAAFFPGEPIIVRVRDSGQNGDPVRIETIIATITATSGDFVTLRLYESGPDTGEFFAWIDSAATATPQNDAMLSINSGATLTATYQDPFDATEISTDVAGVDPFGRVFDSVTGALIDGAAITIVHAATGAPAQVFGIDGVSAYPSTVVTGAAVTDASGFVYPATPGQFRFPIMAPGDYRVTVAPPVGYSAPSAASPTSFGGLANAPFTILAASYGGAFTLTGADVEFDIPVDPSTALLVTKSAGVAEAAVGDLVRYRVLVENRGSQSALARVADTLPKGMRYRAGSARLNGAPAPDPVIAPDGRALLFTIGATPAGATATLAYVVDITGAAPMGEAVNAVRAVDGAGRALSNRAEASVLIRDDFLREGITIAGRVTAGCDAAAAGVEGVRIYLETGATTTTDERGQYHFEDAAPGVHVAQLDIASLPAGHAPTLCRDTTRRAGSAFSQFVDARGGSIWRADFAVERVDRAKIGQSVAPADAPNAAPPSKGAAIDSYNAAWLKGRTQQTAFVYPQDGSALISPSSDLAVMHPAGTSVSLLLNGAAVEDAHFSGRDVDPEAKTAVSRWRGVDLAAGDNNFIALVRDASGAEIERVAKRIAFVDRAERVVYLNAASALFADGRTEPTLALRFTDRAGRPVHAGRAVSVALEPPYQLASARAAAAADPVNAALSARSGAQIGADGVALVRLAPTVETGPVRFSVELDDGRRETFSAYMRPALRDWIVVGLATGEASAENRPGAVGRDLLGDGRVAGFAKGTVKGGWLVTIAGDTDKKRGREDDALFDAVDPDDRYPLYGDRSDQAFEAQSRYPVYLKAEKGALAATLGDFDTGMTRSKLARYSRRLTGGHVVYDGAGASFNGFVSDTNQSFLKDELPADGTSGPYRLTAAPLVRNSETLTIETRDRFRPDIIIGATPLARYVDYDIDYQTGEVILRLPAPAADASQNPNVIVADYETSEPLSRAVTMGGRAALRFDDGRAELGATYIREQSPGAVAGDGDLAGVDAEYRISPSTRLRAEIAASLRDGPTGEDYAKALLVEAEHESARLRAGAYYQETEAGFGLAQQSGAVTGVRRFGARLSVMLSEIRSKAGFGETGRYVDAEAYREENLADGATRDFAEVGLRQETETTSGSIGLRGVEETLASGEERRGLFAVLKARQHFEKLGLTLRAGRDQRLAGEDASALFPTRTTIGIDQRVVEGVTLSATHEVLSGDIVSQSNTIVGLTVQPWTGASLTAAGDRATSESGERIGAVFGVDQQVRIDDNWSASLGVARREDLKNVGLVVDAADVIAPDPARSPFAAQAGAYTALYLGAGYRDAVSSGSVRLETKSSEDSRRYTLVAGAARELADSLTFAAAARAETENRLAAADERRFDARLGAAWRPDGEGLIILNRFDLKQSEIAGEEKGFKAVHNLAVNALGRDDRLEVAFNHGLKYAVLEADGARHAGVTQLAGLEARYDLSERVDIGLHVDGFYQYANDTLDWSYGPSLGLSPADNIWLTLGWNFSGFDDEDFAAAAWRQDGPFVRLRIKFDQTTAKGLLDAISPEARP